MTQPQTVKFLGIIVLGLLAWTGVSYGQAVAIQPITPVTVTGPDFAFRIEGMRGTTPVGRLLVRVDGRWAEVDLAGNSLRSLAK